MYMLHMELLFLDVVKPLDIYLPTEGLARAVRLLCLALDRGSPLQIKSSALHPSSKDWLMVKGER